jgi:hypothetical protein
MTRHALLTPALQCVVVIAFVPFKPLWAIGSAAINQALLLGASPEQAVRVAWPCFALARFFEAPVWHAWWWYLHHFEGHPRIGR